MILILNSTWKPTLRDERRACAGNAPIINGEGMNSRMKVSFSALFSPSVFPHMDVSQRLSGVGVKTA